MTLPGCSQLGIGAIYRFVIRYGNCHFFFGSGRSKWPTVCFAIVYRRLIIGLRNDIKNHGITSS